MYEQGSTKEFDADKFFNPDKFWYHIATNARSEGSIWRKIRGKATTCDNVIVRYAKVKEGVYAYQNACYVQGHIKKSLARIGTLTRSNPNVPSEFTMTDEQSGQQSIFQVLSTDYDNFALVTDNTATFWIMSRSAEICGNTLGKLKTKLAQLGMNTTNLTVDFQVVKDCANDVKK